MALTKCDLECDQSTKFKLCSVMGLKCSVGKVFQNLQENLQLQHGSTCSRVFLVKFKTQLFLC